MSTTDKIWPTELTPALKEALGLMNFRTGPLAAVYRAAGFEIKHRCEDEQAFILHRFAGIALEHGDNWRAVVGEELEAMLKKATEHAS